MKNFQVPFLFSCWPYPLISPFPWTSPEVFKLSKIGNKITFLRTNSQSLTKNKWKLCVTRVTWLKVKVLMTTSRFAVEIGDKSTMINSSRKLISSLERSCVKNCWVVPKNHQVLFHWLSKRKKYHQCTWTKSKAEFIHFWETDSQCSPYIYTHTVGQISYQQLF